jgi:hypothetical protein
VLLAPQAEDADFCTEAGLVPRHFLFRVAAVTAAAVAAAGCLAPRQGQRTGGGGALQALREGGSKRFCFSNTPLTFEKKATTFFFLLKSRPPLKKKKTSSCRRACGQHFHPAPLTRRPRDKTACGSISVVTHLTVRSAPSLSRRTTNCRRNNTYNERALELGLPLALQQEMLCGLHSLLVVLCALSGKTDAKRTSDKHTLDVV